MKNNNKITKQTLILSLLILSVINSIKCQVVVQNWCSLVSNSQPYDITNDSKGNIYIKSLWGGSYSKISKISPNGVCISALVTLGAGNQPSGIVADALGNIYTADNDKTVSKITPDGICNQSWATLATGASPKGIAIDAIGNVYTANGNNTISKISIDGVCTQSWAILATGANPQGLAIDAIGNVYTANMGNNTVSKITSVGVCQQNWATLAPYSYPTCIAVDSFGNVFTANKGTNTVSKITKDRIRTLAWATLEQGGYLDPGASPYCIAVDILGNVYTANSGRNTISKITVEGVCTQNWVTLASDATPMGITIDSLGNIYTANLSNRTVSLITTLPTISTSKLPLTGFTYQGTGPSAEQSFSVNAYLLTDALKVTPPADYEISLSTGVNFSASPSITLTHNNGVLASTTIYVRLKAGLAAGSYNESINFTSTGAVTQNISLSGTLNAPAITPNISSLSGFTYSGNGPSAEKSFTISGTRLNDGILLTPPADYEISLGAGTNFIASPTITLTHNNGVLASTTIYVRLKAGLAAGSYNESINLTSTGATTRNVSLSGTLNAPAITPNISALTGFTYSGNGPSAEKSFTVSGTRLSEGIVLTAPDNYEMSIFAGTNFVALPSITLAPTNGELAITTIYVRLKAGLAAGLYNESINLTSTGAVTKNISLSGTLNAPAITPNISSLTGFTYSGNGPSAEKSFTVSGTRLSEGVVLTAPDNYEISIFTGANFIALPTITLAHTNGLLASNTIYVRLKAGIASGTYNESLSLTTLGGENKTVALSGTVTNPAIVTSVNQISGLNYTATGPSTDQFFSVSGLYLSSSVLITSPTNFEISLGSGASFTSASPVILSISAGTLANKNIYTRLKSGLANGTYTGNIQLISTGAPTQNIALTGIVGPTVLPYVSEDGCKVYGIGKNIIIENAIMGSPFAVYNIYGAEIISGKLSSNIIKLDSAIPVGVYFIKLNNKIAKVVL